MLSDNALKCRLRLAELADGVDEAVVEVDVFLLCFDDRVDGTDDAELEVHEAFEEARERVRSSVEVAGDESAEKWLPVT